MRHLLYALSVQMFYNFDENMELLQNNDCSCFTISISGMMASVLYIAFSCDFPLHFNKLYFNEMSFCVTVCVEWSR